MTEPIAFRYNRIPHALYWKAAKVACKPVDRGNGRVWNVAVLIAAWVGIFGVMLLVMRLPAIRAGGFAFVAGLAMMWIWMIACGLLGRRRMQRTLDWQHDRRGPTDLEAGPGGLRFASSFGDSRLTWRAIDAVLDLGIGTGLKSGLLVYPIPNDALPEGLSPRAFRETLETWRQEAGA